MDPMYELYNIKVYNICDFIDDVDPDWKKPHAEISRLLVKYCTENNVSYYAAPRELFSYYDAVTLAKNNDNDSVIVEDLS